MFDAFMVNFQMNVSSEMNYCIIYLPNQCITGFLSHRNTSTTLQPGARDASLNQVWAVLTPNNKCTLNPEFQPVLKNDFLPVQLAHNTHQLNRTQGIGVLTAQLLAQ